MNIKGYREVKVTVNRGCADKNATSGSVFLVLGLPREGF